MNRSPELSAAPPTNGNLPSNSDAAPLNHYRVVRRDGRDAPFLPDKISIALGKAFLAAQEKHDELSARSRDTVAQLTTDVVTSLTRRRPRGGEFDIEEIQ